MAIHEAGGADWRKITEDDLLCHEELGLSLEDIGIH